MLFTGLFRPLRLRGQHQTELPPGTVRHAGGRANSYTCRTLDNGTAILSHISLTRRWFSAHDSIPSSVYF
ncbi:hypothetical protein HmCmsJML035_04607 [Escherichia coli]|nr:hypothetical protein [Escherichia coli]GCV13375.1 hypothetical protein HmCmsJML035_04607 [Escherichia coli]